MGSYTKISHARADEILALYELGEVRELTPLSLGISNSNYKVETTKGTWLLKISNDKNREQLAKEQQILLYLQNKQYKYSLSPLPLKSGEFIYDHETEFGVIYPFIDGIPPGPGDQTCEQIGRALALLHKLCPSDSEIADYGLRPHEEVGYGPKEILDYTREERCPEDFRQAVEAIFPDKMESFIAAGFERCLIHGDLYYDNTLFDHNYLAKVLDFEQAGIGEAILDLGISISGTCLEKGFLSDSLVVSYLRGYESVRPLPNKEREALDKAIALGLLSIALWRIKRFRDGDLDPTMANSYLELVTKALIYSQRKRSL